MGALSVKQHADQIQSAIKRGIEHIINEKLPIEKVEPILRYIESQAKQKNLLSQLGPCSTALKKYVASQKKRREIKRTRP